MPYTNDTKPNGNYTNDESNGNVAWADTQTLWSDPIAAWGGGASISQDTKPGTPTYVQDVKPS